MRKIWLISRNTYRHRVRSGSFLFGTFFLPVLMIIAGVVAFIVFRDRDDLDCLGWVDQTQQLSMVTYFQTKDISLSLINFEDIEQAQAAFKAGQINAYLLIPPGYFQGEPVVYYGEDPPGSDLSMTIERMIRKSLLPDASESTLNQIEDPATVIFVEFPSGAEISSGFGLVARVATPAIMAALFAMAVVFTTGQMGSAVVREKEQSAMEIVITSLRPSELVAGNVLGMSLLVLTQFSIWISGGIIALLIFTSGEIALGTFILPWGTILWGLLLILPGFLLFAILAAGAGIIAGDCQQAQQLPAFVGLLAFVPLWFTPLLMSQPDGNAAIALTLFLLTAPTVALLRMAFAVVPTWQLAVSFASILLSLVLATWILARIFRAAMLIYGQPLRPLQLWQALHQS